jgi:hypothetical protein
MTSFARIASRGLPWLVSVVYAVLVYGYYATYLDASLRYIPPSLQPSREDILGFGFLSTWCVALLAFLVACVPAYKQSGPAGVAVPGLAFVVVTAVDYFLWCALVQQVPL